MMNQKNEFPACLGCGYCCKKAPCSLAMSKHGAVAPCPSLRFHDGRYWCGEVEDAKTEKERNFIVGNLYIGAGCCSSLNSDRRKKAKEI